MRGYQIEKNNHTKPIPVKVINEEPHFVISVTFCSNFSPHSVIRVTLSDSFPIVLLCNNCHTLHFARPATLYNKFLSNFVTATDWTGIQDTRP